MNESSCPFSIKKILAMRTASHRPVTSIEVEPQNHFSPEIKARLAQIVDRLVVDGFGALAFGLDSIEAVNQLAATDLEQRVTASFCQSLFGLAKIINHLGHLMLQLEQVGVMSEQRILSLEQLAIDLGNLADHLIPVAQLDSGIANIFCCTQSTDGGADE